MPASDSPTSVDSLRFVADVAGAPHTIRATWVVPIAEALGCADQLEAGPDAAAAGGSVAAEQRLADLLDIIDSHLIAAPRPRRRRERPVSSRAIFYAGGSA